MMFDQQKPTAQMLGRFQPWHDGHTALFVEALNRVGQVLIMVRNMPASDKNPYTFEQVKVNIDKSLKELYNGYYEVISVPNITNVYYGRDVGYSIEYIDLPPEIQAISATEIRAKQKGE
jgi:nicotinamide mononucleotide adenylyltransferase